MGGGLASLGATGNVIITDSKLAGNIAVGGNGGNFNNGAGSNARGARSILKAAHLTQRVANRQERCECGNGGNPGSERSD